MAWHDEREQAERSAWERMRIAAAVGIQPHVKSRITPQELIPLPWDTEKKAAPLVISKKEEEKRVKELLERLKKSQTF